MNSLERELEELFGSSSGNHGVVDESSRSQASTICSPRDRGRQSSVGSGCRTDVQKLRNNSPSLERKMELKNRQAAMEEKAMARRQTIEKIFVSSCAIDLAFLSDATGSMGPWIKAVADQIIEIAENVTRLFNIGGRQVRYAYVAYRDYRDYPRVQALDFTVDLGAFTKFVRSIRADGGDDECEDVFSGLEQVAQLTWRAPSQSSKVLFHLADAPCHGRRFHKSCVGDDYPGGDKLGRDIVQILHDLRVTKCINHYSFSHIKITTQKMMAEFKKVVGPNAADWIIEDIGSNTSLLTEHVMRSVSASVSASLSLASLSIREPSLLTSDVTVDATSPHQIDWHAMPLVKGLRIRHNLPETVQELITIIDNKEKLHEITSGHTFMRVATRPFSLEGSCRLPYYARMSVKERRPGGELSIPTLSEEVWVVKRSRSSASERIHVEAYKAQMEVQSVAACLANVFNKQGLCRATRLHYTMVNTFVGYPANGRGGRQVFNYERHIEGGTLVKFNNNYGYVNFTDYVDTVHAFSHWTHDVTGGRLMVVDIQGLYDTAREQFTLFDPAVHCPSDILRFGTTNLGDRGIDKFFLTHKCNSICQAMRLKQHPMQIRVNHQRKAAERHAPQVVETGAPREMPATVVASSYIGKSSPTRHSSAAHTVQVPREAQRGFCWIQ